MNFRKLLTKNSSTARDQAQRPTRADKKAVAQYERMLREAPLDTIEQAHIAAFEKLTPVQLGLVFDRFSAEVIVESDRPADASPAALARSAAHAEAREPGTLRRVLGGRSAAQPNGAASAGATPTTPTTAGRPGTAAAQAGAAPAGAAPAGSAPLGAAPAGSAPAGAAPLGSAPAGSAPVGAAATGDLLTLWTYSTIFDTVATLAVAGLVWSGENFDLGGDIAGWDDWF